MIANYPSLPLDFLITLNPIGLHRSYGLVFYTYQGGKKQKIHYEVNLSCDGVAYTNDFCFQIDKRQVYINNNAPDTLLDGLADKCGRVLYPLFVKVDYRGQFTGIKNGAEIRKRWQEARSALTQYYTGNAAADVFDSMDAAVASDRSILEALRRDWLFALLFPPIYHHYHDYTAVTDISLPLVPYRIPVQYTLRLKVSPQPTESGFILIEATGDCTDARSLEDVLKGNPVSLSRHLSGVHTPLKGKAALIYKVYPHNGSLFSVTGSCSLCLADGGEKTVDIELYQLGKRDPIPDKPEKAIVIPKRAPEVQKKKDWHLFGE